MTTTHTEVPTGASIAGLFAAYRAATAEVERAQDDLNDVEVPALRQTVAAELGTAAHGLIDDATLDRCCRAAWAVPQVAAAQAALDHALASASAALRRIAAADVADEERSSAILERLADEAGELV